MSSLVWYDEEGKVRGGHKRHLYERKEMTDRTVYERACGNHTSPSDKGVLDSPKQLSRVTIREVVNDVNACKVCLRVTGLDDVNLPPKGGGAENVDYDPFGVFD